MKNLLYLILLLLLPGTKLYAQEQVKFGIYIRELVVDDKEGFFTADFYWWQKFKTPADTTLIAELSSPEFIQSEEIASDPIRPVQFGEYMYVSGRYRGKFRFNADYHDYPKDRQTLAIKIENINLNNSTMGYQPDMESYNSKEHKPKIPGLDSAISIPDYNIISGSFRTYLKDYHSNFGVTHLQPDLKYSRIEYDVIIERKSPSFILKILIPGLILLIIPFMAFMMPANRLDAAVTCTVTSMLACIALQLTINSTLPDIGYLTRADKMFYLFYALITYALVHAVYSFNLDIAGTKSILTRKYIGRVLFPLVAVVGLFLILFF